MSDRGRGGYGGRGDRGGRGGRGGGGDFGGRGGPGGGGGHYGGDRGNRGGGFDQRGRGPSRPRGGPIRIFREGNIPRPDPEVAKVESAIVQDITRPLAALSVDDQIKLPLRPGYGTAGQNIILWTNYFQLNSLAKNAILFRYAVSFQGETAEDKIPKPKKKRLIQLLLQQPPFSSARIASDWAQNLVSMKKLDLGADKAAFDIEWYPEDGEPPKADDDETRRKKNTFKLLVIPLLSVSLNKLLDDIKSSKIRYTQRLETIQALNIVLGSGPSSDPKIAVSGTNKFYPFNPHRQYDPFSLGGGLMAYRGYYTSVRTGANRMLVNVNVATGAFYRDGPLLDIMNEIIGDQKQSKQHYDKMTVFVRKLRFETTYLRQTDKSGKKVPKRKVHTITDLSPFGKNSTNVTFTVDGKTLTVQEHFSKAHGIRLRFPPAPLVNYGERNNPKWIPAELCTVLGGQLARRLLQGEQTRAMISFAARPPFDNATNIVKDGLQVAKLSANDHLKGFNLHVNPELLTVNGRILPPPVLQYRQKTWTAENGAWNLDTRQLGRNPFKVAKRLGKWACVLINLGNQEAIRGGPRAAKPQLETFRSTLESYGLAPPPLENKDIVPITINFHNLNNRNLDDIQKTIISGLRNGLSGKPSFVLFLLPNDNAVVYDCIKHVCDVQLGLPNVCSIATKFTKERGQLQYFANLALKFNQKLGGVNHSIGANSLKPLDAQTIVFGIDVTHPSPGSSEKSPSIAGVVASIDAEFSQYPASMRTQEGRKEMVTDLKEMVTERLKTWSQYNKGALPSKVFVYRDGVSEGQYSIVMKDEYPHFVTAFNEMYGDVSKHPKVSIIVVGKRHHTRFYPTRKEDADPKNGNPKPGTVVDRGVTDETLFDFFLLAHQGLQGTSKPAHYVVLKDDNRLGADQLQVLTHNLCYTFARATRAVSICPPAYYADLLCERGRCFLHAVLKGGDSADNFDTTRHWTRDVHSQVAHTMYYL